MNGIFSFQPSPSLSCGYFPNQRPSDSEAPGDFTVRHGAEQLPDFSNVIFSKPRCVSQRPANLRTVGGSICRIFRSRTPYKMTGRDTREMPIAAQMPSFVIWSRRGTVDISANESVGEVSFPVDTKCASAKASFSIWPKNAVIPGIILDFIKEPLACPDGRTVFSRRWIAMPLPPPVVVVTPPTGNHGIAAFWDRAYLFLRHFYELSRTLPIRLGG